MQRPLFPLHGWGLTIPTFSHFRLLRLAAVTVGIGVWLNIQTIDRLRQGDATQKAGAGWLCAKRGYDVSKHYFSLRPNQRLGPRTRQWRRVGRRHRADLWAAFTHGLSEAHLMPI